MLQSSSSLQRATARCVASVPLLVCLLVYLVSVTQNVSMAKDVSLVPVRSTEPQADPAPPVEGVESGVTVRRPWSMVYPLHANGVLRSCHMAFSGSNLAPGSDLKIDKSSFGSENGKSWKRAKYLDDEAASALRGAGVIKSDGSLKHKHLIYVAHVTKSTEDNGMEEHLSSILYDTLISGAFNPGDKLTIAYGPLALADGDMKAYDKYSFTKEPYRVGYAHFDMKQACEALSAEYTSGSHLGFSFGLKYANRLKFPHIENPSMSDSLPTVTYDDFLQRVGIELYHDAQMLHSEKIVPGLKRLGLESKSPGDSFSTSGHGEIDRLGRFVDDKVYYSTDAIAEALIFDENYVLSTLDSWSSSIAESRIHGSDSKVRGKGLYCSELLTSRNPTQDNFLREGSVESFALERIFKSKSECKSIRGSNAITALYWDSFAPTKYIFVDYIGTNATELKSVIPPGVGDRGTPSYSARFIGCPTEIDITRPTSAESNLYYANCSRKVFYKRETREGGDKSRACSSVRAALGDIMKSSKAYSPTRMLFLYTYGRVVNPSIAPEYFFSKIHKFLTSRVIIVNESKCSKNGGSSESSRDMGKPVPGVQKIRYALDRVLSKYNETFGNYLWHLGYDALWESSIFDQRSIPAYTDGVFQGISLQRAVETSPASTLQVIADEDERMVAKKDANKEGASEEEGSDGER